MTLLPSFNEIRGNAEILANPDSRLTGVKRLATLDPSFFLLQRAGVIYVNSISYLGNEMGGYLWMFQTQ